MSLPYFPMYPTDFEAKTSHLTLEEDGAYNRLLRLCWMSPGCSLPDDDAWIKRRMRVDQDTFDRVVKVVLDEFFTRSNGRLSNARLIEEFEKSNAAHQRRKSAGSKGGNAKALKTKESAPSNATSMPEQCSSNQNQNQNHIKKEPKGSQKKGSRLPDSWSPSSKNLQDAQALGLTTDEVRHEADKFRDYWISKPGAGGRKVDWDATWRNWCRNASQRRPGRGHQPQRNELAQAFDDLKRDIQRAENGEGDVFSEQADPHGGTVIELDCFGRGNAEGTEARRTDRFGDGYSAGGVFPSQGFR